MTGPDTIAVRAVDGMVEERDPARSRPWGWVVNETPGQPFPHLLPTWDMKSHTLPTCACRPEIGHVLDGQLMIIHKSFDGRERYERGDPLN